MNDRWYEEFFTGTVLDFHRWVWRHAEANRAFADGVVRVAQVPEGGSILDVPAGNGRYGLEFAELGYRVVAQDLCDEFVAEGMEHATKRGQTVEWRLGDMRALEFSNEFDAVTCLGGSFGYLGERGDAEFVAAAYKALVPGGRFILDTDTIETNAQIHQTRSWDLRTWDVISERRFALQERQLDFVTGWVQLTVTILDSGSEETRVYHQRLYSVPELRALFNDSGFTQVDCFRDVDGETFDRTARRLLLVATKA